LQSGFWYDVICIVYSESATNALPASATCPNVFPIGHVAVDECDAIGDVTRRDVINDGVLYEDEFIGDVTGDDVDAASVSSPTEEYEQLVLTSSPVRSLTDRNINKNASYRKRIARHCPEVKNYN